ncbi:MAG: rod shape-determining protein MreD [Anaerovoracaceae bacterium]|nr:rod shape-determining protein MreD [Anaerovoracaceae bacterium]
MRYWKAGIIFLIAFFIQPSLLNMINIGGYTPNLLLCLTVIFSFLYEKEYYGPLLGAVSGLLYDICYSYVIGPTAIALLLTAVIVMALRQYANVENIISMWVVSVLSFLSYYLINWILYKITGSPEGILYALSHSVWTIVYSMAVITAMYILMIRKVDRYHKDRYYK